jgi:hypothetical protein
MKGISDVRLRIQCANVSDHAKILPIQNFVELAPGLLKPANHELKLYFARRIGEIICGNSGMYIYKPGDRSPMGTCVLCGGALSFEIQEWTETVKSGPQELAAYHSQQSEQPRGRRIPKKKAS